MSLHYLGKVKSSNLPLIMEVSLRSGSMATKQSRPQPSGLQDMGVVQERVYQSWVHSIDELKQRLLHVWHVMDQSIIDSAVDEWRLHLRACVRTRVDTTSTCCDTISMPICTTMWHETFYVVLNMIWFLRLTSVIRGKFELLTFPR